jgi:multidrug resistance protein, MATE family
MKTSYFQILKLSLPIMLGSAAQNIIVLSDNVFLYHSDQLDFASIGIIGSFYLIIASIGYGFSRGGQILMARKFGEQNFEKVGSYFQSLIFFELIMAFLIFLGITFFSKPFFSALISNEEILKRCLDYIKYRSYGVFFSFAGVAMIGLYTGIARNKIILYDTIVLALSNIVLNYIFIFGAFGVEPMGIKGAAIASTLSEVIAFVVFIVYMIFDKELVKFRLLSLNKLDFGLIKNSFSISFPILAQSALALVAYFLFFTWIENTSAENLKISNLIRNVYLILSIPSWGYATGINTIVSFFIGKSKRQAIDPLTFKTSVLNISSSLLIAAPILIFPSFFLFPLYGTGDGGALIEASKGLLLMLIPIIGLFCVATIYHNSIVGTGHTKTALWIQALATLAYLVYIYIVIKVLNLSLYWAWCGEFVYWTTLLIASILYLRSKKWFEKKDF